MLERWLARPVRVAAVLLAAAAIAAFLLLRVRLGPAPGGERACTVVVEHFGVDGTEIERSITQPLEDALASLAGVREIRSLSELGRSRVTVWLSGPAAGSSQAVRDAVARVSAGFPTSVQKPRVFTGAPSERPVFIAALRARGRAEGELADLARRELEPGLAKVPGAGEIEIGGEEVREVHVRVDARRAASFGLTLAAVAAQLQGQCVLAPAGSVREAGRELPLVLRARPASLEELSEVRIRLPAGVTVRLADIAAIGWGARERESISRVDGSPMVVLYVQSAGTADPLALSRGLRSEVDRWIAQGLQVDVLLDDGEELRRGIVSVASAGLEGLAAVTLLLPFLVRGLRKLAVLWASLPLTVAATVAALAGLGVALDRDVLAGLAVGIGTIIDTGVIVSGQRDGRRLAEIAPSLAASLLTTLIVLVPLAFLEFAASGIRQVALAMGVLLAVSYALSVFFLPAFALGARSASRPRSAGRPRGRCVARRANRAGRGRLPRRARRFLLGTTLLATRRPGVVLAGSVLVVAASIASIAAMGVDFAPQAPATGVSAHVELEPEATVESTDQRISAFAGAIRQETGVILVESIARRGAGDLRIEIDPGQLSLQGARSLIKALGQRIPGGFVYLPEAPRTGERAVEIALLGDDHGTLRRLARSAAQAFAAEAVASEVVLNFKEPAQAVMVRVNGERASGFGASAAEVAAGLRWSVHGPVALKWLHQDREVDLRVMAGAALDRQELLDLPLVDSRGASHSLATLAQVSMEPEGARLYRKDRQPAVFMTVQVPARSLDRAVDAVAGVLDRVSLPRGYGFQIDRSAAELARNLRTLWLVLGLSIGLIWLLLAALSESLLSPLAILAIVPTSLALPLLGCFLSGQPLRVPTLVGLVVLSGMVVNNSILVIDGARGRLSRAGGHRAFAPAGVRATGEAACTSAAVRAAVILAVRSRIAPLLVTTGATVLGTLPLLFAGGEGGLLGSLAFVILWGMLGSLASTVLILPAILGLAPRAASRPRGIEDSAP